MQAAVDFARGEVEGPDERVLAVVVADLLLGVGFALPFGPFLHPLVHRGNDVGNPLRPLFLVEVGDQVEHDLAEVVVAGHDVFQEEEFDDPHEEGGRAAQEQFGVQLLPTVLLQQGGAGVEVDQVERLGQGGGVRGEVGHGPVGDLGVEADGEAALVGRVEAVDLARFFQRAAHQAQGLGQGKAVQEFVAHVLGRHQRLQDVDRVAAARAFHHFQPRLGHADADVVQDGQVFVVQGEVRAHLLLVLEHGHPLEDVPAQRGVIHGQHGADLTVPQHPSWRRGPLWVTGIELGFPGCEDGVRVAHGSVRRDA